MRFTRLTPLALLSIFAIAPACDDDNAERSVFLAGKREASVVVVHSAGLPRVVTRKVDYQSGAKTKTRAVLDKSGFVVEADFERKGPGGTRVTKLRRGPLAMVFASGAYAHPVVAVGASVVLLEFLVEVSEGGPCIFVDVVTGDSLAGAVVFRDGKIIAEAPLGEVLATVNSTGDLLGPGAFFEGTRWPASMPKKSIVAEVEGALVEGARVDGALVVIGGVPNTIFLAQSTARDPPTERQRRAQPFIESDAPRVKKFAARPGRFTAAQDALFLMEKVHAWVKPGADDGGPPSALHTLATKGGNCDDVTTLVVALMRARGHAARPVVGYRVADGKATPHAWAEFWDGEKWVGLDASWLKMGINPQNIRLFEGLGSSLTMARLLGVATFTYATTQ